MVSHLYTSILRVYQDRDGVEKRPRKTQIVLAGTEEWCPLTPVQHLALVPEQSSSN